MRDENKKRGLQPSLKMEEKVDVKEKNFCNQEDHSERKEPIMVGFILPLVTKKLSKQVRRLKERKQLLCPPFSLARNECQANNSNSAKSTTPPPPTTTTKPKKATSLAFSLSLCVRQEDKVSFLLFLIPHMGIGGETPGGRGGRHPGGEEKFKKKFRGRFNPRIYHF